MASGNFPLHPPTHCKYPGQPQHFLLLIVQNILSKGPNRSSQVVPPGNFHHLPSVMLLRFEVQFLIRTRRMICTGVFHNQYQKGCHYYHVHIPLSEKSMLWILHFLASSVSPFTVVNEKKKVIGRLEWLISGEHSRRHTDARRTFMSIWLMGIIRPDPNPACVST